MTPTGLRRYRQEISWPSECQDWTASLFRRRTMPHPNWRSLDRSHLGACGRSAVPPGQHGSPEPTISAFVAEYLMPFHALIQKVGNATQPFQLGCALMNSYQVIEGQKRLNDALATCMREGKPDVTIDPLALLVLGGAVDSEITNVFRHDLRYEIFDTVEMKGFYDHAYRLGRPRFFEEHAGGEGLHQPA